MASKENLFLSDGGKYKLYNTTGSEFEWNWIITDMLSFLLLGLKLSDSAMATASGVRTYIFHVAAQPPGFSAA